LLSNIHLERTGELINRLLMKTTLSMLVDLGINSAIVYEEDFETQFLEKTAQFYKQEAQDFIANNTCPDYMRKAEQRLNEERLRVTQYLDSSTEPRLKRITETELIEKHALALTQVPTQSMTTLNSPYDRIHPLIVHMATNTPY
jgi:cullin 3